MKATQYDRIFSSGPVNRTAAVVTGRGGIHFEERPAPPHMQHWQAPPQTVRFSGPAAFDMTARAFGRFVVTGYFGKVNKKQKGMWLCRCGCGDFELRTTRAISNAANGNDRCCECRQTQVIQKRGATSC